jgi:hypothetical protein
VDGRVLLEAILGEFFAKAPMRNPITQLGYVPSSFAVMDGA